MAQPTLRGMATISYWADDVKAARAWYAELLGIEPYFERPDPQNPAYVEFRIGDYQHEMGIIDRRFAPSSTAQPAGGVVLYWHVDDLQAMFDRLLSMGCKEYEPITPREENFITAAVLDPFGNIVGVMQNPHYVEVLKSR